MRAKPIVKRSRESKPRRSKTDLSRVDKLTDWDIATAIEKDSDAAPRVDADWFRTARIVLPRRKVPIALRVDSEIIEWFKARGKGYQSRMNAVLRAYVDAHRKAG